MSFLSGRYGDTPSYIEEFGRRESKLKEYQREFLEILKLVKCDESSKFMQKYLVDVVGVGWNVTRYKVPYSYLFGYDITIQEMQNFRKMVLDSKEYNKYITWDESRKNKKGTERFVTEEEIGKNILIYNTTNQPVQDISDTACEFYFSNVLVKCIMYYRFEMYFKEYYKDLYIFTNPLLDGKVVDKISERVLKNKTISLEFLKDVLHKAIIKGMNIDAFLENKIFKDYVRHMDIYNLTEFLGEIYDIWSTHNFKKVLETV